MREEPGNSKKSQGIKLTADILQKYRAGKLSPVEMHQVELLLMDDPFAVEALEGMEEMENPQAFSGMVEDLNTEIRAKSQKEGARVVPIYLQPWNMAAAVSLLIVAGYLILSNPFGINSGKQDAQGPLAVKKTDSQQINSVTPQNPEQERPEIAFESDNITNEVEPAAPAVTEKNVPGTTSGEKRRVNRHPVSPKDQDSEGQIVGLDAGEDERSRDRRVDEIESEETIMTLAEVIDGKAPDTLETEDGFLLKDLSGTAFGDSAKLAIAQNDEIATGNLAQPLADKEEKALEAPRNRAVAKARKKSPQASYFVEENLASVEGTVIAAEDGRKMPGVSIQVKNTSRGVVTDIDGKYRIPVSESDSILIFNFIGYAEEEINFLKDQIYDVEMEPEEMALSEVVILAEPLGFNEDDVIPLISASPNGGRAQYKRYLQDSLNYPAEAIKQGVEGKVKVSFQVDSNGHLSAFEVKRSLGYGCDEEVIRLIKEGPEWTPATKGDANIKQKMRVRVKFKMQKK